MGTPFGGQKKDPRGVGFVEWPMPQITAKIEGANLTAQEVVRILTEEGDRLLEEELERSPFLSRLEVLHSLQSDPRYSRGRVLTSSLSLSVVSREDLADYSELKAEAAPHLRFGVQDFGSTSYTYGVIYRATLVATVGTEDLDKTQLWLEARGPKQPFETFEATPL
jgi:hypothetical protein